MTEKLVDQLRKPIAEHEAVKQAEAAAEAARFTTAAAAREARVAQYAEGLLPQFISRLTSDLEEAAIQKGERTASITETSYDELSAEGTRAAMGQTAEYFEAEGLETNQIHTDNYRVGAAHGDLEEREYIPATKWTSTLTARVPDEA